MTNQEIVDAPCHLVALMEVRHWEAVEVTAVVEVVTQMIGLTHSPSVDDEGIKTYVLSGRAPCREERGTEQGRRSEGLVAWGSASGLGCREVWKIRKGYSNKLFGGLEEGVLPWRGGWKSVDDEAGIWVDTDDIKYSGEQEWALQWREVGSLWTVMQAYGWTHMISSIRGKRNDDASD